MLGRSLLLSLVAADLERRPGLRVSRAADWTEASALLAEQVPDVLIFDPESGGESHVLRLLLGNPDLLLVGLDTERNQAILLSWRKARALTMQQIGEMVEGGMGWEQGPSLAAGAVLREQPLSAEDVAAFLAAIARGVKATGQPERTAGDLAEMDAAQRRRAPRRSAEHGAPRSG